MKKRLLFLVMVLGLVALVAPAAAYANTPSTTWEHNGWNVYLRFDYTNDVASSSTIWDQPVKWCLRINRSDGSIVIPKAVWTVQGNGYQKSGSWWDGTSTLLSGTPTVNHLYTSTKYNAIWINTYPPLLSYWGIKVAVTWHRGSNANQTDTRLT